MALIGGPRWALGETLRIDNTGVTLEASREKVKLLSASAINSILPALFITAIELAPILTSLKPRSTATELIEAIVKVCTPAVSVVVKLYPPLPS